ncbi:MAG: hypothetical protein ACK55I_29345, partial [bacterium]
MAQRSLSVERRCRCGRWNGAGVGDRRHPVVAHRRGRHEPERYADRFRVRHYPYRLRAHVLDRCGDVYPQRRIIPGRAAEWPGGHDERDCG